jgi:hypothetical protein
MPGCGSREKNLRTYGFSGLNRYKGYLPEGLEAPMRVPEHPTQVRRMLDSRLNQLAPAGPLLAASLAQVHKRCGQLSCRCHHDGPLHTAHHLTLKVDGKTRTVYVPQDLLQEVQQWVAEYHRLKNLMAEISQLTLALVKSHIQERKRKKGRP